MRSDGLWSAFCACLLLAFCACSGARMDFEKWDASFEHRYSLASTSLMKQELILGRPFMFKYADSSLFVYDYLADSLFVLIDLNDHNRVYRFGQRGQGDNEFVQPTGCCLMPADSVIGIYDYPRKQLRAINLRQVKRGVAEFPVCWRDTLLSVEVYPTAYNNYVGKGFYEHNMLSLTGDAVGRKYFFEYPYRDSREQDIPNRLRGMAYQGSLCVNPSLNRFVFAVGHAPILMLFSVDGSEIKKNYEWIGGYPEYKTEVTEQYSSAPMSADNINSFIDAYATDKYVYLLYSGKTAREADVRAYEGTAVYRLTWEGHPVDKLVLDWPSTRICVSPDDGVLYSMANKGEIEIVKYLLKNIV